MNHIELKLTPLRTALLAGHANELYVLVRAQAPDLPAAGHQRQPLNLAIVLDRSGSMAGRPLEEAKRCAAAMVERLGEQDRLAIVAYDNTVRLVVPSTPVHDKANIRRALADIDEGGATALYDGWLAGAEQAAAHAGDGYLSRVLLLSDGCANDGLTDEQEIAANCARMAEAGVSTSTYGLAQHFNEELMMAMAKSGQGRGYYGESADDLMEPFQEEFDLMSATCLRHIRLAMAAPAGIELQVLNPYERDGNGHFRLPDLAYGGEVWALLRLKVPAGLLPTAGNGELELLTAGVSGTGTAPEQANFQTGPAGLQLPALPQQAFSALAEDEVVKARRQELRAADLQERARLAARRHDWAEVERLLQKAEREAENNEWLQGTVEVLRKYARERDTERFAKEAHYQSHMLFSRVALRDEVASADYSLVEEMERPSFLRRKKERGKRLDKT